MQEGRPLPPAGFNPTVHSYEDRGGFVVSVDCWGREVARLWFDPASDARRDWPKVVMRWSRMVVAREYRKWLAEGKPDARL